MSGLLVGNLDFETRLATYSGPRRVRLTQSARRAASALATLLRAFAGEEDVLWTPEPVDPARIPDVPGLPRPKLVSGPLDRLPRFDRILAWGEDDRVFRRKPGGGVDPVIVARANHRAFALDLARRLGVALSGAAVLRSVFALERHLAEGGAAESPDGRWVLKPPFSTAGRGRVFGEGETPSRKAERAAARILLEQEAFLFEPWVARRGDLASAGFVTAEGPVDVRGHRQRTTPDGRWRATVLEDPGPDVPELLRIATECGRALFRAGYRGPFGVDAYRYRDRDGAERLHPLGEINARVTFGHVTRRLAERLRGPLGIPEGAAVGLFTGGGKDDGFETVSLLEPGNEDRITARFGFRRDG